MRGILDELPLALLRLFERDQHRVEGVGERRELVRALHLDPLREVARRRDALGGLAQLAERAQRRARHQEPGDGRDPDADGGHEQQPEPDPRELVVDVGQLGGDLEREPRPAGDRRRRAGS